MRIFKEFTGLSEDARGAAVALGNFDGIHLGHQVVIGEALRIAKAGGIPSSVMTFDPHPRRYFKPNDRRFELTTAPAKGRQLAALGIDILFSLRFDASLAAMPAATFVSDVLLDGIGTSHLVAGYDFVFGQGRKGDVTLLREMGAAKGFAVTVVPLVQGEGDVPYSSTLIRNHLREGRPLNAAALLGRYWEIEGEVQTGDQRGRQIGFPTANVDPGEYVMPALGVYVVWVGIVDGEKTDWRKGIVNVGRRPTFEGEGITVEAHIFDFSGDLYGRIVRVAFVDFLRPEMKFDGIEAIRSQIEADCGQARRVHDTNVVENSCSLPRLPESQVT